MFTIKQNDTSPALKAVLRDGKKQRVNLTGANAMFHMKSESGVILVNSSAVITDPTNGEVSYLWSTGDTTTTGICLAEFQITYSDGTIETFPNNSYIKIGIISEIA